MKKLFLLSLVMILLSIDCLAATYYIDGSNGNDGNSGTAVTSAWRTISKANSVLRAGDTVYIRAGTYSDPVRPANSGSLGNLITYMNYNNEEAVVSGMDIGIDLSDRSYIVVDGIDCRDPTTRWITLSNSDHCIIQNGIYEMPGSGYTQFEMLSDSEYNQILDNTFDQFGGRYIVWGTSAEDPGSQQDIMTIRSSSHNRIEGNYFKYASHNDIHMRSGSHYNVVRDNIFENKWHSSLDLYDYSDSPSYVLIEGNIFRFASQDECLEAPLGNPTYAAVDNCFDPYTHPRTAGLQNGPGTNEILRENVFFENGVGSGLGSSHHDVFGARIYHNTFYNNYLNHNTNNANYGVMDNFIINNIYFDYIESPYYNDNFNIHFWATGSSGDKNTIEYNIISDYPDAGGALTSRVRYTTDGNPKTGTLSYIQSLFPDEWKNNMQVDPLFVDAEGRDFNLQAGSPAVDAARHLTLTNGAGANSRTLRVDDAGYFFSGEGDPWNVPGTVADTIYIDGAGSVQIESIDHSTNTITLASPMSWSDNAKVYHRAYSGSAPDIGAFEYTDAPSSCAGTDTSCGIYPDCSNCDRDDGCFGSEDRDYYCSGSSCSFNADDCSDCSCSCGGYGIGESISNGNCGDGLDNDCDGGKDSADSGCQSSGIPLDYVSYYDFEGDVNDATGNNDCSIQGNAALYQDNQKGNVISFDGINSYLDCGPSPTLNKAVITVSLWVRPLSQYQESIFISRGDYRDDGWYLWAMMNNDLQSTINGGGKPILSWISSFFKPGWQHLAIIINGSSLRYFKDGTDTGSNLDFGAMMDTIENRELVIGDYSYPDLGEETYDFNGYLDDIIIYDRVLNDDEILRIYQNQKPKECASSADADCDGCVDDLELVSHIDSWKGGSIIMLELLDAIDVWKGGCG